MDCKKTFPGLLEDLSPEDRQDAVFKMYRCPACIKKLTKYSLDEIRKRKDSDPIVNHIWRMEKSFQEHCDCTGNGVYCVHCTQSLLRTKEVMKQFDALPEN